MSTSSSLSSSSVGGTTSSGGGTECTDGQDNDVDGCVDGADPGCSGSGAERQGMVVVPGTTSVRTFAFDGTDHVALGNQAFGEPLTWFHGVRSGDRTVLAARSTLGLEVFRDSNRSCGALDYLGRVAIASTGTRNFHLVSLGGGSVLLLVGGTSGVYVTTILPGTQAVPLPARVGDMMAFPFATDPLWIAADVERDTGDIWIAAMTAGSIKLARRLPTGDWDSFLSMQATGKTTRNLDMAWSEADQALVLVYGEGNQLRWHIPSTRNEGVESTPGTVDWVTLASTHDVNERMPGAIILGGTTPALMRRTTRFTLPYDAIDAPPRTLLTATTRPVGVTLLDDGSHTATFAWHEAGAVKVRYVDATSATPFSGTSDQQVLAEDEVSWAQVHDVGGVALLLMRHNSFISATRLTTAPTPQVLLSNGLAGAATETLGFVP